MHKLASTTASPIECTFQTFIHTRTARRCWGVTLTLFLSAYSMTEDGGTPWISPIFCFRAAKLSDGSTWRNIVEFFLFILTYLGQVQVTDGVSV